MLSSYNNRKLQVFSLDNGEFWFSLTHHLIKTYIPHLLILFYTFFAHIEAPFESGLSFAKQNTVVYTLVASASNYFFKCQKFSN